MRHTGAARRPFLRPLRGGFDGARTAPGQSSTLTRQPGENHSMDRFETEPRARSLCQRARSGAPHQALRHLSLFLFLALFLAACSLAGDVTPLPGATSSLGSGPATGLPATAEPTSATSAIYPEARPAAQDGGLLYVQH